MKLRYINAAAVVLPVAITNVCAQDWPQYLWPDRNGKSPWKNLLRTLPIPGPSLLWKVNLGIGFGGPAIKNGKVFLLDRDDKAGDKLRCLDFSTGKELRSFSYDPPVQSCSLVQGVYLPLMVTWFIHKASTEIFIAFTSTRINQSGTRPYGQIPEEGEYRSGHHLHLLMVIFLYLFRTS